MSTHVRPMTRAELMELARTSPTTDVPTASRALGFGPNLGYELVSVGQFPCRVLRLGRKLRVPTADLLACLGMPLPQPTQTYDAPQRSPSAE